MFTFKYAGEVIRHLRLSLGYTQKDMAMDCNCSLKLYRELKRAELPEFFDPNSIAQAARVLSISPECLFCEQGRILWEAYKGSKRKPMTRRCK